MYIMNYAAEYNLYPVNPGIFHQQIDTVTVTDVLSFEQLSEFLGISREELEFLNPTYKVGIIPSTKEKRFSLRLPYPYVGPFIDHEQEIYNYKSKKGIERDKLLAEIKKAKERNIHVVRSGENLGLIAQRYRCSVSNLKSWNNLRSNTIYPGQKLVVFAPGYTGSETTSSSSEQPRDVSNLSKEYHLVRNGENLGLIAQKYNCTVSDLKKWNNLSGNTIHPNQKLLVYAPQKVVAAEKNNTTPGTYVYHTVKKGDTLWDIAQLYDGVTVDQIKKLNNINNSKRLKPGQKLKVGYKG
jgi:membrane-bound lytic murein transglycosylase D